jgi:hypothetical protein
VQRKLEALIRHYHHLEIEQERARPEGSVRHQIRRRMREDCDRFERLLAECARQDHPIRLAGLPKAPWR